MWDPGTTGGVAEAGLFDLPWAIIIAWTLAVTAIGRVTLLDRAGCASRGLLSVVAAMPFLAISFADSWDPLSAAEPFGPGEQVAEVRDDGMWMSDSIEHASSWSWSAGEPCLSECRGPRYIYRVRPGEPYAFLATVRNDGPVAVTLLGRARFENPPGPYGLALLRDSAGLSTDPSALRPFEPVRLDPGAVVTVAVIASGHDCADPSAEDLTWERGAVGYVLVYEVLGWKREGTIWPHFSVTQAGCH